jgi:thioredoxin reductase (NADPH)
MLSGSTSTPTLDLAIVGSGPAGLSAADAAQRAGFTARVYEKGCLAESIFRYPTFMRFHSTAENLELGGLPLIISEDKPTRHEYLEYLRRFAEVKGLDARLHTEVTRITGRLGQFRLTLRDRLGEESVEEARFVVIATGGYDTPQPLGVPGEHLPKVRHYFDEPHPHWGQRVLIVGGKNSAVETALVLARAGAHVTVVHRRGQFEGVKYWLRPDIENRIREGTIEALMPGEIVSIEPRHVTVRLLETGEERRLENDMVFAMTGFQPDLTFLERCGVAVDRATKQPHVDAQTLETNVPGIFCAGVIVAGAMSSMIFIENARFHGDQIVARMKQLSERFEKRPSPR